MSNTLKFGNGQWGTKVGSALAYNDLDGNFKPLPFDFTRSTSGTRINKDGLIEVVTNNKPRIDFKDDAKGALLLEPTRSNLITYSEAFDNAYWTKSGSSVVSGFVSPKGDLSAFKLVEDTSTAIHYMYHPTIGDVGIKTASFFVKAGERNKIGIRDAATGGSYVSFDLENGVILDETLTATGTIKAVADGWYKISIEQTITSALRYQIFILPNSYTSGSILGTYTGDGTSGIYIFGAQLEVGSYATSYIPTQGATATRVAETCVKNNIDTSIISSSYPFTMYVESTYIVGNEQALSFINSSVPNNYYVITINSNVVNLDARANGLTELISSGVSLVNGQKFKAAITMQSATSGKICVNGNTVISKTNFSNQSVNSNINDLLIGQLRLATDNGQRLPVSDVKFYNTALTDSELQALTTL